MPADRDSRTPSGSPRPARRPVSPTVNDSGDRSTLQALLAPEQYGRNMRRRGTTAAAQPNPPATAPPAPDDEAGAPSQSPSIKQEPVSPGSSQPGSFNEGTPDFEAGAHFAAHYPRARSPEPTLRDIMAEIKSMKRDLRKVKRRSVGAKSFRVIMSAIAGLENDIDSELGRVDDIFTAGEQGQSVATRLKKLGSNNRRKRQSRKRRHQLAVLAAAEAGSR
ncbi:uncharacterized protein LOC62_02G002693 [Vanrija pseudolonga]|uniref:Uncharacterized protein n=1 Tax=Vanrija pseudolonga TaxID=143232 RepID=A0AAF0Y2L7_9TREE|nr:hypothetical protein LOC62_02G002693 [Vanrija pseudolonga]